MELEQQGISVPAVPAPVSSWRALVESTPQLVWIADADGRVVAVRPG